MNNNQAYVKLKVVVCVVKHIHFI